MKEITLKTQRSDKATLRGNVNLWIHSESNAQLSVVIDDINTRYSLLGFCVAHKLDFWVDEDENTFLISVDPANVLSIGF